MYKALGGPWILPDTFVFPKIELCLRARAQLLELWGVVGGRWWLVIPVAVLWLFIILSLTVFSSCLHVAILMTFCSTVNFSAASYSAHWLPLCLNGHPSFLFMSLTLTPGPYPLPFCLLNRAFFFFFKLYFRLL